ncbi:polysaccharide deacetylase family protein [Pseudemcibacter aquimaris]|uniref:polysaccharide deacetylase family protein n=1 Tax=Pseudemcibacter aquimaris TaxID=2857064 RepID=UPI0020130A50|nr:polysaccharide deacetylase family protein [Pseudemcibacter aquimaris]MCC3862356.1 polysaccharide deacetylase family protein [Pseudemcibacter aquimaris]WDU59213.1 polysaccharide deacetylase family protein [Pseudemcibacter aquimaris]
MKKAYLLFCLIMSSLTVTSYAQEEDSAIIIMYHRFGESKYPSTNITLDQIDQHIAELSKEQYNIVPLKEVVDAIKSGKKLPPRTIAITIDDGFLSVYEEAWPRFKKAGFPVTVFVSTEPVSAEFDTMMSWDHVREMAQDPLIDIGHHAHAHGHMSSMSIEAAVDDLDTADRIFMKELGYIPDLFAYPFGEYSPELVKAIEDRNYKAIFGQHSGAISSTHNINALPRFAFNENYSDMGRVRLIFNARALPVKDVLPRDPNIGTDNPPAIGFTVNPEITGLTSLGCFPSHTGEAAELTLLGDNRVELRFDQPFPNGRSRINCTMPGPDGRWYWLGLPFFNLNN